MELYPLKFQPILKEKIWGGQRLMKSLGKNQGDLHNVGESWELSGYDDSISVVTNGYLADNRIDELIEVYMGELVGDKVYEQYGLDFPLLFKFIDATDKLSIQVHPNDDVALQLHDAAGKNEMWVVLETDGDGRVIAGFKHDCSEAQLRDALATGHVEDLLQHVSVKAGDVIEIPAGLVHGICKGVMLAEIQQSSDLTYRIYDYDRTDSHGHKRDLHIDHAMRALNFSACKHPIVDYTPKMNGAVNLVNNPYFTTNMICFDRTVARDYALLDSFVVYMCLDGAMTIQTIGGTETLQRGQTILIPNSLEQVTLHPTTPTVKILETYIA